MIPISETCFIVAATVLKSYFFVFMWGGGGVTLSIIFTNLESSSVIYQFKISVVVYSP